LLCKNTFFKGINNPFNEIGKVKYVESTASYSKKHLSNKAYLLFTAGDMGRAGSSREQ
jgi:hypothetical protein